MNAVEAPVKKSETGSREKRDKMLAVHQEGRAIVWSGGREKGEMYVNQLHSAQLNATLEKAE